jgi:hypothetical protein
MTSQLTKAEVIRIYRKILGRYPESEDVINGWLNSGMSPNTMAECIVKTPEFTEEASGRAGYRALRRWRGRFFVARFRLPFS